MDLLPITVKGVPSMHICLDFAPELLRQSDMDKQAFTVDLISHLSVQYALPKSFSTARLAVNVLSTLLSGNSLLMVTILRFLGYNRLYILRLGAQSSYVVKYFEGSNAVNAELDNTPFLAANCCLFRVIDRTKKYSSQKKFS